MAHEPLLRRVFRRRTPAAQAAAGARPAERTYEVDGPDGAVTVVEQGVGSTIVIVHGGSGDLTAWAGVADRLAGEFRVLRYTRPTYRLHPAPRGSRAAAAEVADALAVTRSAGGPVLLVGHSSGAVVALETALSAPEELAGLALYEPPLDVTHTSAAQDALRRARTAIDAGKPVKAIRIHLIEFVELKRRVVLTITLLPPVRRFFSRFADAQIADNEMLDSLPVGLERFCALELHLLLIAGETSPDHLRRRSDALAAVWPTTPERVELAGQGHGANNSAPEALASAIGAFAKRVLPLDHPTTP